MNRATIIAQLPPASRWFLGGYLLLTLVSIGVIAAASKPEIHLAINAWHHPTMDEFFKAITHLGEPTAVLVVSLLLLLKHYRWALILWLITGINGLLVTVIKKSILDDMRPFKLFQHLNIPLYLVPGIRMHEYNTFPSGHTAIAFGMLFLLSLLSTRAWAGGLFLLLAVLVAWSRMYLSMHFLVDVVVGAAIGMLVAALVYYKSVHSP
ncbi:MAG: phosphatase PAP2 family protein [Saprospiraceae bacterium]